MGTHHGTQIAFFGSSLLSAYWNGAATYYRGIIRSLHNLGYSITFFEPNAYQRQEHRDVEPPDWAKVEVYAPDGDEVYRALESARTADWIIKASGVGVNDELLEREVLSIGGSHTKVAFWDVDAPATLDRVKNNSADPFRRLIPRYDVIFTYGGGEPVIRGYLELGAKMCVPIYNALDPDVHYPVEPDPAFRADLSFLGNRLPDREARVEEFFLKPAAQSPQLKFLLGGSGWESKAMPPNVTYAGHVFSSQHNALNCSARAVLNVTRDSMASYGFSPATRVFEAAGAGACIITDAWTGIEMFLEPDTEILVATTGDEVTEILNGLTGERARSIGEAARRRVLRDHTYTKRAAQVESVFAEQLAMSAGD